MTFAEKTKIFYSKCVRVWHVLKKPSKKEFNLTAKVSGIGIIALGLIGFVVATIMDFI